MNNNDTSQEKTFVTFSNIPLDDTPLTPVGYDSLPPEAMETLEPQQVTVVDVQFKKCGKVYYFDPGTLQIEAGQDVIIETARGPEYGFCAGGNHSVPVELVVPPLRSVLRVATDTDKETRLAFQRKQPEALVLCQQKIKEHNLDMKLVSAEYSFDGSKILFYFTADGRVDFRDLVKDLAGVFRTRIELRQIGVRDEAKLLGGLGICGRPFCCKQFLEDFQPVSIKMAKTQSLSLNPTKISGTCGRLMCCLKYEQDAYESLIKTSPKADSLVNTYDGVGTVTDSNLLRQSVKVRLENDPSTIKTYQNEEIVVLRNGKARKTDPPIPTDLPPLPRPEKQPVQEEITLFDESKLSNYTDQDAARDAEKVRKAQSPRNRGAQNGAPAEKPEEKPRSRNRSRSKPRSGDKAQTRSDSKAQTRPEGKTRSGDRIKTKKPEAAQPAQEAAEKKENKSRSHRRRYYRGKKPSGGGQTQTNG